MLKPRDERFGPETVRADFVPKDDYLSPEFARLEEERLWPRVWQIACREEEIPQVGDFVTYDILNESFIVIRTDKDEIRAYYNVCPHRGRRLTEGCGRAKQFVCRFHGWRWNLQGDNTLVVDKEDWQGCLSEEDLRLKQPLVGRWGGYVFINMDTQAEPLETYLAPVPALLEKFEFAKLRYRWYRTVIYPCNWKVLLEGFNEAYHVQQTHSQMLQYLREYSNSGTYGKHSAFWYPPVAQGQARFGPSPRLGLQNPDPDVRKYVLAYMKEMHEQLGAMVTPRSYEAAQRLLTEVPADASSAVVMSKLWQFQREAAEADGAGWPDVTPEDIMRSRSDWHVFPNHIFLHATIDGVLAYRVRPNGSDTDSCIFDVWSLVRYAPGKEPPLKREFYTDWRQVNWGRVLTQDFQNLSEVQKGMKSRAFAGSRTNPVQEQPVSNFHRTIRQYLAG
jgi:phenylpropionate dioxygenase-like ring-hydroxylating dioxygenase large terminal subunit